MLLQIFLMFELMTDLRIYTFLKQVIIVKLLTIIVKLLTINIMYALSRINSLFLFES